MSRRAQAYASSTTTCRARADAIQEPQFAGGRAMLKISNKFPYLRRSTVRLRTLISKFCSSTRGNVAIMTGLAAVPMLAGVGCVVDYTMASMVHTKLQAAADAATLATVSNNSPITTSVKTGGGVPDGVAYLTRFFSADVNAIAISGAMSITPPANVAISGSTMTATLTFTAQVPTFFMGAVSRMM